LHHRLISATPPAFVIDAVPKPTCPGGTLEISRWCKPPVRRQDWIRAPAGAAEIARRPFRRPCRGSPHFVVGTGGLHHRLISATPPAFVIDAVPKLRKLGTFVTVLAYTKRLTLLSPDNSPVRRLPAWVLDKKKNASRGRDGRSVHCLLRLTLDRTLLSSLIRDSNTSSRDFPAAIVSKRRRFWYQPKLWQMCGVLCPCDPIAFGAVWETALV